MSVYTRHVSLGSQSSRHSMKLRHVATWTSKQIIICHVELVSAVWIISNMGKTSGSHYISPRGGLTKRQGIRLRGLHPVRLLSIITNHPYRPIKPLDHPTVKFYSRFPLFSSSFLNFERDKFC